MKDERPPSVAADGDRGETRVLRVASEYRRSCLYLVVGAIWITALIAVLPPAAGAPRRVQTWAVRTATIAPAVLLWLYAVTWRLRIDPVGLARRRLGR